MPMIALLGCLAGSGLALIVIPTVGTELRDRIAGLVAVGRKTAHARAARSHSSDLAVVGWTPTDLVTRQLIGVVVGATVGAMLYSVVGRGVAVVIAVTVGGGLGFVIPISLLRTSARKRRRSFVHAFSAYLDLVNVLLAGGAGIETALVAAAEAGDGWAFGALRSCVSRARLSRRSPWGELRDLGTRWEIGEVVEVAGSMNLSGEHGARIRTSLAARADSIRSRQVAEIEAMAQSATERMGVPVMMLFVGFMVLLGYPALQTVVMNM